ncbi:MAG: hypothetical protein QOJ23_4823 [Actinomycetota bacterium]|jgi:hypothetical protein|nr:hypothetical protein [Actinomycetota bacterium]MDQ1502152.1 hypothetical protein [Actinomycetota bacterium]MDQ1568868.1 hypothetical protein [Actinomycetota bacterium]
MFRAEPLRIEHSGGRFSLSGAHWHGCLGGSRTIRAGGSGGAYKLGQAECEEARGGNPGPQRPEPARGARHGRRL